VAARYIITTWYTANRYDQNEKYQKHRDINLKQEQNDISVSGNNDEVVIPI
jgi:hypothetical protein